MLDVRRMQILRAVVTSGSVTAAAAELGYTPSAVSQQVAALEREAGTALLERAGRGVRPTAAGLLLTQYTATISRNLAEAEAALADLRAGRTGSLAVRYFGSVGPALVAPALARLRREHPGVRLDLTLLDPQEALAEVARADADVAVVVRPREDTAPGLRLVHLLDDEYLAALPPGHALAARRVLDLADLAAEPWVGSEPQGPCLDVVLGACAAAGFSPDFVAGSEDYATALGFVAAGLGVGLVPRLGTGGRRTDVVLRRVRNPRPVRTVQAAVREGAPAHPALTTLLEALAEAARRSVSEVGRPRGARGARA
ncbi:Transcriptional regulator, LysR family [Streptomyces venezuelae]|uniref:LysR family transcriptional regulator n=1 Tax=Streptomyces gardneri TaxID=66892 RepID=UPI0006E23D07|nr:LysR family transcriptional regulator [Streptomyces gardneri]ALO06198.1 Transcriptional regulator, LysR family [Streptomyces venezuelae]QPK43666.1 LysR family transcriptional regulator [Streptomyces gardneri]WRK34919.1 LysR family transcriptional regulator [Streptomyces venezuelae]